MSTFRPVYRDLSPEEKELSNSIKTKAEELEALYHKLPQSRFKSIAMTKLEESVMWIIKGLTQ